MTLGSLFDGAGGFPLAAVLNGIEPLWASEIEPFPIRVTTKRFPNMQHVGDITVINGADLQPVDIITFGSPCQDMSISGKRLGISGQRSGLFMQATRIIKEMRHATHGTHPTFIIWENVFGAFSSSRGEDFKTVLQEICSLANNTISIPRPEKRGWLRAGEIMGNNYSVAWRTIDAQYWGVPQRRRRIFLVADFRGQRASEILFERTGVSGYLATGDTARQYITTTTRKGIDISNNTVFETYRHHGYRASDIEGTVTAGQNQSIRGDTPIAMSLHQDLSGQIRCGHIAYTLSTNGNPSGRTAPIVCHAAVCIAGNTIDRQDHNGGNGIGASESISYTLNTVDHHAVAYRTNPTYTPIVAPLITYQDVTGTLSPGAHAGSYNGQDAINDLLIADGYIVRRLIPLECSRLQGFPDWWCDDLTTPNPTDAEVDWWAEVFETHRRVVGKSSKPKTIKQIVKWLQNPIVASALYKMWGNGVALPCVTAIMRSIVDVTGQ